MALAPPVMAEVRWMNLHCCVHTEMSVYKRGEDNKRQSTCKYVAPHYSVLHYLCQMFSTRFFLLTWANTQAQNNPTSPKKLTFLNPLTKQRNPFCWKASFICVGLKKERVFDLLKPRAINLVQHQVLAKSVLLTLCLSNGTVLFQDSVCATEAHITDYTSRPKAFTWR